MFAGILMFLQLFGGVHQLPLYSKEKVALPAVVSDNSPSGYFNFIWPDSLVNNHIDNVGSISIDSVGDIYAVCTAGDMIVVSTDKGNTWETSLNTRGFPLASVVAGSYVLVSGQGTGTFRIKSGTNEWCSADSGLPKPLWVQRLAYNPAIHTVFAVSYDGAGIYKSSDFGDVWTVSDSGFVEPVVPGFTTYPILQDIILDTVSGYMYCSTGGFDSTGNQVGGSIWKSTDNGSYWVNIGLNGSYYVESLAVWNGTLYAATIGSGIFYLSGDSTWIHIPSPNPNVRNGRSIWFLRSTKFGLIVGFMYWGLGVYLMQGTPSSPKWKYLGLAGKYPLSVAIDDAGYVYIGEEYGVWKSTMPLEKIVAALNSPPQINSFIPVSIDSVGINTPTIFSVLATDPDGDSLTYHWKVNGVLIDAAKTDSLVYTFHTLGSRQTVTCVVADTFGAADSVTWNFRVTAINEITQPFAFALSQNYPNPFNPTTSIKYQVESRQYVTLTVYDILGRLVTTLVDGEKAPGSYTATFDGSKLPSGVYFYRLQAGSFTQTRRMVLMK